MTYYLLLSSITQRAESLLYTKTHPLLHFVPLMVSSSYLFSLECTCFLHLTGLLFKAPLIFFIKYTMNQMTMCNVKGALVLTKPQRMVQIFLAFFSSFFLSAPSSALYVCQLVFEFFCHHVVKNTNCSFNLI